MKDEQANINLTLSPDVVSLLQIAVGHLALSIDNGSFDVGNKTQQKAVLDNLEGLHYQMEHILSNFS